MQAQEWLGDDGMTAHAIAGRASTVGRPSTTAAVAARLNASSRVRVASTWRRPSLAKHATVTG
jgi:hypothetical protein